jgi:hypothetical protein
VKLIVVLCIFLANCLSALPISINPLDTIQSQSQAKTNTLITQSPCYQGIIELGYAVGVGSFGMNNFRFNFINGLRRDTFLSFGLGVGIRYFSKLTDSYSTVNSRLIIPLFLSIRTNLSGAKISPYLGMGIGGAAYVEPLFSSSGLYPGLFEGVGFYLNPSSGVRIKLSEKCGLTAGFAYEIQEMNFQKYPKPVTRENAGSLSFNCGVSF